MFAGTEFHEQVLGAQERREPFAIATVIRVRGSASAKPGSKAIISAEGRNVYGWVGGGCAESFVCRQAVEAMEERQTRIVTADLDDEIFGLGMPCGGVMDVYIEPQMPPQTLELHDHGVELNRIADHLASTLSYEARIGREAQSSTSIEDVVGDLAGAMAKLYKRSLRALVEERGVYTGVNQARPDLSVMKEFVIVGHSRITQELAKWASVLSWPTRVFGPQLEEGDYPKGIRLEAAEPEYRNFEVDPNSVVIIASHHRGDHEFLKKALAEGAVYTGLIASEKRAKLVLESLRADGHTKEELARVFAPAGLDIGGRTPAEIALSCVAEVIALRKSRS